MISPGPSEPEPATNREPPIDVAAALPEPGAPTSRRSNPLVLVALLGAVALLLASGGTGVAVALRHRHGTRTRQPEAVATPSRSPASNGHHSSDLLSYLVPQPADARHHDSTPDDGILGLADAAAYGAHPDAWGATLTSWKFIQGARRRWVTSDGLTVAVTLFQFATNVDATEFARWVKNGTDTSSWGTPASLPDASAAFCYSRTADGEMREFCLAYRADLFVQVSVTGEYAGGQPVGPNLTRAQLSVL